ncbi:amidohydrolase [Bacillus sp. JZ8]
MKKAFYHCDIFTLDHEKIIKDGMIITEDEKIAYIGKMEEERLQDCEETYNWSGKWVMPGLVNSHVHIVMNILRGVGDDMLLHPWLTEKIWPLEAKFTTDLAITSSKAAIVEMIKSGTTLFNDMFNPIGLDVFKLYEAVKDTGMKGNLAYTLFSNDKGDEAIAKEAYDMAQYIKKDRSLIRTTVAPHSPYSCSEELLRSSVSIAKELDLPLHIHVSETEKEMNDCLNEHKATPVQYLADLGFYEQPTIFAHGVVLTDEDVALLNEKGTSIAHNPISNLKLGSGVADISRLNRAGVNVAIATDSVASNNNLDMFEEMRTAALLQKGTHKTPEAMPAYSMLKMATLNGAKALGYEDTGVLKEGYKADFISIDPRDKVHLQPLENASSHLLYAASGKDVSDSVINGNVVMENRVLLTLDEERIIYDLNYYYKTL